MSLNVLADLDSFYQQQADRSESKAHENEDDWGDFQGSQCLGREKIPSDMGKPFSDNQVSRGEPNGTGLLFDAVDGLTRGINVRNIPSEPTKFKTSIIPTKGGSCLGPVTEYKKTAKIKEQNNKLPSFNEGGSNITQGLTNATEITAKQSFSSKAVESPGDEEEWSDFTLTPVVRETSKAKEFTNSTSISLQSQYETYEQEVPPTNIPPPALILTILLQVISESKNELLQLTNSCKEQNSHENCAEDADFLRAYVEIGRVLARVIAGRKLRWKRDQILSQGMKIGPASVKRVSGMKLAGIDKAEMGREEKEVLDIVEAWREQLGRLRITIAAFGKSGFDKIGIIPEIQLNIPVKSLKETEGGLSSKRPCALCGLKRNERVHRVDVNVHDSFGEWWIESMNMHRTCKFFWQSHKSKLQSS